MRHSSPSSIRQLRMLLCIALALAITLYASKPGKTADLKLVGDVNHINMEVAEIETDSIARFTGKESEQAVTVSPDSVVRWGSLAKPALRPFVLLCDGTEIIAQNTRSIRRVERDLLFFRSDVFGDVSLPVDSLRAIVLLPPGSHLQRDKLTARLETRSGPDEVLLTSGDIVRGRFVSMDDRSVTFYSGTREQTYPRDSIVMLAFDPKFSEEPSQSPVAIVGLSEGDKLFAERLMLNDDSFEVELYDGTVLQSARYIRPVEDRVVSFLQPLSAKVDYLSDHAPASYRYVPFLSGHLPYGLDRDVFGRQLSYGSKSQLVAKGIAMHSTSRLTFSLPTKNYRTFAAELILGQTETRPMNGIHGSVIYRVFLKNEDAWREAYKSDIVRRENRTPVRCRVDLANASAISLVVDYADDADVGDHALWLDARLEQ
ncbi:MAG: NPCBM/NEW2 domain-containing protein [Planctomycetales bacterium]|nr:NPCBM/NEW2 domain-containing protein [Planctomycetales bacterium]